MSGRRAAAGRLRSLVWFGLLPLLAACSYRVAAPQPLGEPLAISIVENRSRLVRSQAQLQQAVGSQLRERLAWEISPHGPAELRLSILEERLDGVARSSDGSTIRWRIRLRIEAELVSELRLAAPIRRSFTGSGTASGRRNEEQALAAAAADIAARLADWLEQASEGWPRLDES